MKRRLNTRTIWLCLLFFGGLLWASSPVVCAGANFTVGWDPNSEADLDGYGIYVRRGSPGPPYQHIDDVFLDELSDPDNPHVTLTEYDDGTYYIAATAFDTEGNESGYSRALCVEVSGGSINQCISYQSADSASDAGGGGGGGGGCLISSAGERFGSARPSGLSTFWNLSVLLSFFALLICRKRTRV